MFTVYGNAKFDFEFSVVCRSVPLSEIVPANRFVVDAYVKDASDVEEFVNVCRAVQVFALPRFRLNDVPLYESPVPAVVVAVHVGTPPTSARTCPFVPCDVVEILPEPLPRSRVFVWNADHPVPPWATERSVVRPVMEVISELVPDDAAPRFVLAPDAVVAPVPP